MIKESLRWLLFFYIFWICKKTRPSIEAKSPHFARECGHFGNPQLGEGREKQKFYVEGQVQTESDEAYTSHNTNRLDVDGVVKKIMGTDYVKEELEGRPHVVEA